MDSLNFLICLFVFEYLQQPWATISGQEPKKWEGPEMLDFEDKWSFFFTLERCMPWFSFPIWVWSLTIEAQWHWYHPGGCLSKALKRGIENQQPRGMPSGQVSPLLKISLKKIWPRGRPRGQPEVTACGGDTLIKSARIRNECPKNYCDYAVVFSPSQSLVGWDL